MFTLADRSQNFLTKGSFTCGKRNDLMILFGIVSESFHRFRSNHHVSAELYSSGLQVPEVLLLWICLLPAGPSISRLCVAFTSCPRSENSKNKNENQTSHQVADGEWDKLGFREISELVISKHWVVKCGNILQSGVMKRKKKSWTETSQKIIASL